MITVTLDDERVLGVTPVAPHEAMKIAEGCRELSGVRQWWRVAMKVAAIRMIDGVPMPMPTHPKHIEGLVSRFSKRDMKAISEAEEQHISEQSSDLELLELTPLETLRIWALIGELETAPGWVAPAFIAATVRKIDEEKVPFPCSKDEMRDLVARLGTAGMIKASRFMLDHIDKEKKAASDKEAAVKN